MNIDGNVAEASALVSWLAGDRASSVTRNYHAADGGYLVR